MPMVEEAGAVRWSGQPAAKEDRRGGHRGSSTVTTPPEVDVPEAVQGLS
jgi:hypothetical protein